MTVPPDVVLDTLAFKVTGGTANRSMADRLADEVNVSEFGAAGQNSDYTTQIQAAINRAISQGGNIVRFPAGLYQCGNLTVGSGNPDLGVQLIGAGKDCCQIIGINSGGYLISKGAQAFDNVQRIDGFTIGGGGSGAMQLTGKCQSVMNLRGGGLVFIEAASAESIYVEGCLASTGVSNPANSSSPPPGALANSIGYIVGSGATINCRAQNYNIGYAITGEGVANIGCSAEVNNIGCRVGWSTAGEAQAVGCVVEAFQTERCNTGFEAYNMLSGLISGNILTGAVGTPGPSFAAIASASWSGGLVTVNTVLPHNIGPNGTVKILQMAFYDIIPNGYIPPAQATTGFVVATVTGPSQFRYPGVASNPGAYVSSEGWNYPLQYGMRMRKVYDSWIYGAGNSINASIASVDLDYNGEAEARNNVMSHIAKFGWLMPTNTAKTLAGWKFTNCGGSAGTINPGTTVASPNGFMNFADLPGQAGVLQDGPFDTQEFDIKDSPVAAAGNFGASVTTGGAANKAKLRRIGSLWTISG